MERAARPEAEDALFAQEVRSALRRVDAPEGFTERLMARAALQQTRSLPAKGVSAKPGVLLQFTRPVWRAAYAAAALLAITAGAVHVEHVRTEQRRAEAASAQLDVAMAVTHRALNHVSAKLEATEFGEVQRALETNGGSK